MHGLKLSWRRSPARLVAYAVLCVEEKLVGLEQMLGARLDELTEAIRDREFNRAA